MYMYIHIHAYIQMAPRAHCNLLDQGRQFNATNLQRKEHNQTVKT